MREKLYWAIEKFSLRFAYFAFFDTTPYLADQLFIKHEVRVWFDKEFAREESPYIVVLCHVHKGDVPQFLAALGDFKKSMMLCGHPEYQSEISKFMDDAEKTERAVDHDEDNTDYKAEQEQTA